MLLRPAQMNGETKMGITSGELNLVSSFLILGGPLITYRLMGTNESRMDERAFSRELAARREARQEDSERRHFEYQRRVLEDLQNEVRELARTTMQVIQFNEMSMKTLGRYERLPEEINTAVFESRIRFAPLFQRVTDDNLRNQLDDLGHQTAKMSIHTHHIDGIDKDTELGILDNQLSLLADLLSKVNDILGKQLRANLKHQWNIESAVESSGA